MSCNCDTCRSKRKRKHDLKMSDRANKWITVRGKRVKLDGDGKIPPGTFDRGKSSKKSTRPSLKEEVTQAQALGKKMAKDGKSKDEARKALIKLEKRNGHAGSKASKARAAGMAEFRAQRRQKEIDSLPRPAGKSSAAANRMSQAKGKVKVSSQNVGRGNNISESIVIKDANGKTVWRSKQIPTGRQGKNKRLKALKEARNIASAHNSGQKPNQSAFLF